MGNMLFFIKCGVLIYSSVPAVNGETLKTFIFQDYPQQSCFEIGMGGRLFLLFVCYFDSVYKDLHSENYLWLEYGIPRRRVVL